ncbi:MAG: nickel-dependent lactate racemase [Peptococcaceae bacterium]|jgi:nickel-dependent lactate racemase|nr:nickel-dependent lactate racemase [Peptococcaceae bacterium]
MEREFRLPYGRGHMTVRVPHSRLAGVLESRAHSYAPARGQSESVNFALDNAIGSPRLEDLAEGKRRIVVITSDHTRPVPSRVTLPILLSRLRAKNPGAEVTILIATAFHRPTTREEMALKFGEQIVGEENIVNHDCRDRDSLVQLGILPSGAELWLNRLAVEADLLVAEGFIEPHFFAGYSGGRKSVLPGVAGEKTVLANHCSQFIASELSRTGVIEGNPMHLDMVEAARRSGLAFILNVVINAEKEVINAFAGDPVLAHETGCRFVDSLARVPAVPADIVVTTNGGYPLDQNIYQSVKGMTAAEASARENAVIIIVAACNDGHGGESFHRTFLEAADAGQVMDRIMATAQENTVADQWESQILARILMKHQVIVVTDQCDPALITGMKMIHAGTFGEALAMADRLKGPEASITVIPDGVAVVVK